MYVEDKDSPCIFFKYFSDLKNLRLKYMYKTNTYPVCITIHVSPYIIDIIIIEIKSRCMKKVYNSYPYIQNEKISRNKFIQNPQ